MITVGARNAITDVAGLRVGAAHDDSVRTGVTVVLPDERVVAAVDVRGGGTGTRELELLGADGTVDEIDAIVLSGGSAFGLAAADGVATWLAGQGRGFPVGEMSVPLVPSAILFDLLNGGDKRGFRSGTDDALPYRTLALQAVGVAGLEVANGNAGAGFGATTTGHDGRKLKGGQGTASFVIDGGIRNANRPERIDPDNAPDSMLDPDAIADSYMHFLDQPRSSWSWEIEVRPWVEKF